MWRRLFYLELYVRNTRNIVEHYFKDFNESCESQKTHACFDFIMILRAWEKRARKSNLQTRASLARHRRLQLIGQIKLANAKPH